MHSSLATLLLPLVAISVSGVSAFQNIIAFADSMSDFGNVYKHTQFPPAPPYFEGRFTNGFTWLEYVAQNFSNHRTLISNAYGGATTNNDDVYSQYGDYVVPGLKQIVATIDANGTADDLYLIFIGYNDLNAILYPDRYKVVNKNYTKEDIVSNVIDSVHAIIDKYQAKEFLIVNVIPFYQWPGFADKKAASKKLITDYNTLLKTGLTHNLTGSAVDVKYLDSFTWFNQQIKNPGPLGVSTTNGPCVWGFGNTTTCADPQNHFFFDSFHPEAKVHAAFGRWASEQIRKLYKI